MSTSITVRDIDPRHKSSLRREALRTGVSMEELVRRLIQENRTKTERRRGLAERFHDLSDELSEDRTVEWTLDDPHACARFMEGKRQRGDTLDDHVPDAFLAAVAASFGLAIVTQNTGEFRNTVVDTGFPWTAMPR